MQQHDFSCLQLSMLHIIRIAVKSVYAATLRESTHQFMLAYTKLSTMR